jgi:hypothetical protein
VVPLREEVGEERASIGPRVAHLLRVSGYLEIAIISMWTENRRTDVTIGMVEASLRGEAPGGKDEDLLERLRALVEEARGYHAGGDFPAAMARMRVAQDLLDLRIVALSGG